MKLKNLFFLTVILLSATICLADLKTWVGTYTLSDSAGNTVGGDGVVVDYTFKISSPKQELQGDIAIEGFQADENIKCTVQEAKDGNSLSLNFKSYDNGDTKNKYGVAQYKVGQELVVLKKAPKPTILWKALTPNSEAKSSTAKFSPK